LAELYKQMRRLIVCLVGVSVIAIGVLMLVLPGPAFIVIPTGLAILAIEFEWARKRLRALRDQLGLGASDSTPSSPGSADRSRAPDDGPSIPRP
jgi:uncharacterized protein (TIGR02611 family)